MTEEEYDALDELLTKATPKVGANRLLRIKARQRLLV